MRISDWSSDVCSSDLIGQIYRLFENKDDVVLALVEENTQARVAEMQAIFDAVQRGQHSVFEAIKAIANISIVKSNGGLSFEILAEAYRNFPVAERLTALVRSEEHTSEIQSLMRISY